MVVKLSSDFITQFILSAGYRGDKPFWQNLKNIFFLNHNDFELAENWFNKCEDKAAFFSLLLPVVRTFISSPLGYRKILHRKTCLYSLSWIAMVFWTCWRRVLARSLFEGYHQIFQWAGYYRDYCNNSASNLFHKSKKYLVWVN